MNDPEKLAALVTLVPVVVLLVIVVVIIARHGNSKPHGLNKRAPNPYGFGGVWRHRDDGPDD